MCAVAVHVDVRAEVFAAEILGVEERHLDAVRGEDRLFGCVGGLCKLTRTVEMSSCSWLL